MQQTLNRIKNGKWLRNSLPFWLIMPTIIVLLVVQVYPALYTGWLSLQEREPTGMDICWF